MNAPIKPPVCNLITLLKTRQVACVSKFYLAILPLLYIQFKKYQSLRAFDPIIVRFLGVKKFSTECFKEDIFYVGSIIHIILHWIYLKYYNTHILI